MVVEYAVNSRLKMIQGRLAPPLGLFHIRGYFFFFAAFFAFFLVAMFLFSLPSEMEQR